MEKILHFIYLYDFYRELLTDKQRIVFEKYYLEDLSMQEIADHSNISRQSVNDLLKRTEKILTDYEDKLKLYEKHIALKEKINTTLDLLDKIDHDYLIDKDDLVNIKEIISGLDF